MNKIELVKQIIESIGDNPNRSGVIGTPERVARMWDEIFRGYDPEKKPKVTVFANGDDGINYDQMICDQGKFYSHCEHHMVPFFGQYFFGYIPDKKLVGLSKVARIVDYYSAKLQIQERLVKEIVDELERELQPIGIGLIMKGQHLCKEMRGVKKNGIMTTSDLRGAFLTDAKDEFLQFANK